MERFITITKKTPQPQSTTSVESNYSDYSHQGPTTSTSADNVSQNSDDPMTEIDHSDEGERVHEVQNEADKFEVIIASSEKSSDGSSINSSTRKRRIYKQKFKSEWIHKFAWLKQSANGQIFCICCNKCIAGGLSHIQRHEQSTMHEKQFRKAKNSPKIESVLQEDGKKQLLQTRVATAELKWVMFLHEHNLPFLLMDHLPKLIKSTCSDSEIAKCANISRTKATLITKNCLASESLKYLSSRIESCEAYSLILDETTDISTTKSLAAVIRFFDGNGVKDHFFGLLEIEKSTAEAIYNVVLKHLKDNNIPMNKLIGLAADNASVMMGRINGVQARFKQDLPNMFVLGCVCHSLHLCASAASNTLPKSVEEFARGIYNYFSNSSNRCKFLTECQKFLQDKPQKMLRPSQTRWLSLQAVVNRILQNWDALVLVFQDAVLSENLHSVEIILNNLRNPVYKLYFSFLSYILDLVNKMNLEFQNEKCKINVLSSRVSSLYRTIIRNFIKKEIVDRESLDKIDTKNPRLYLEIDSIYFGAMVHLITNNETVKIPEVELHNFRLRALEFYVELTVQIRSRFKFNDPVLEFLANLSPTIVISGDVPFISVKAQKYFPQLVEDFQALDSEWRMLADQEEVKKIKDSDFEEFWINIFNMKNNLNSALFPHISKFVKGILSLPHSSAAAERIFSQLNLLKTKVRNKLLVDTCDAILHSKDLLGCNECFTWMPSENLIKKSWKSKESNV